MAERVQLSTGDTIKNKLKFSGPVELEDADGYLVDLSVDTLNLIPSETWALSGTGEAQTVALKTVFDQDTVTVYGNIISDDLDGTDLSAKYGDAIKINEDCRIEGPNITFSGPTVLLGERLNGNLPTKFNNTLGTLMEDVGRFISNLHDFYTENVVSVIPKLDEEIRVAKRLDLGMVSYLDEVAPPRYLAMDLDDQKELSFNASLVSALELDENLFSIHYRTSSLCSWNANCVCHASVLTSPLDSGPREESEEQEFSFALTSGTFILRSSVESYSDTCTKTGDGAQLIISGVITNPESVDTSMMVLTPTTVGSALKTKVSAPCFVVSSVNLSPYP